MIEIRELVIKAMVQQGSTKPAAGSTSPGNNSSGNEEIIKTCVDRIIEIIKDKNER